MKLVLICDSGSAVHVAVDVLLICYDFFRDNFSSKIYEFHMKLYVFNQHEIISSQRLFC